MEVSVKKTGHRVIDAQHLQLFKLLELLEEAQYNGKGLEHARKAVLALAEYVDRHFTSEESLMERINYPSIEKHIALHKELRNEVDRLGHEVENNTPVFVLEVIGLLRRWLVQHINEVDADMAKCLSEYHER